MAYQVEWSELALRRLEEAYDWIAKSSPEAAQKVIEQLVERAEQLEEYPMLGRVYPEGAFPKSEYRASSLEMI